MEIENNMEDDSSHNGVENFNALIERLLPRAERDGADGDVLILEAAKNGDFSLVRSLYGNYAMYDNQELTDQALTRALLIKFVKKRNVPYVQEMLEHADVNERLARGETSLHLMFHQSYQEFLQGLRTPGIDDESRLELGRVLIENGADVHVKDKDGCTPLFRASYYGLLKGAKLLIENGADVDARDNSGFTPLLDACKRTGNCDSVHLQLQKIRFLIENGADVNAKTHQGDTPLHLVLFSRNLEVGQLLLENGADPNAKESRYGWAPLHVACIARNLGMVQLLLNGGASINMESTEGETPLQFACKDPHSIDVVWFLVRHYNRQLLVEE